MPGTFVVVGALAVLFVLAGAICSAIGASRPRETPIPGTERGDYAEAKRDVYALFGAAFSILGAILAVVAYFASLV